MLIFKCQIPHTYTAGKSTRKLSANAIMNMHWAKRAALHDMMIAEYIKIFKQYPPHGHQNCDTYRVSLGFFSGKSTKVFDLDNASFPMMKWAIDAWKTMQVFDDSFQYITEVRVKYLGKKQREEMWFQVEKNEII